MAFYGGGIGKIKRHGHGVQTVRITLSGFLHCFFMASLLGQGIRGMTTNVGGKKGGVIQRRDFVNGHPEGNRHVTVHILFFFRIMYAAWEFVLSCYFHSHCLLPLAGMYPVLLVVVEPANASLLHDVQIGCMFLPFGVKN